MSWPYCHLCLGHVLLPMSWPRTLLKNTRPERSVWYSPAERHRYATRRAEPWSTARPLLGAFTGLSYLFVSFYLFHFDELPDLPCASSSHLCAVIINATQLYHQNLY